MILNSMHPAIFVLAMDDCEVQADCEEPNLHHVIWKNSDAPETLAQFQRCRYKLDLYKKDPTNLLVQVYDGHAAYPLHIEIHSKQDSTEAVFCFPDGSFSEVHQIPCPSVLRITSDREGNLQVEASPLEDSPAPPPEADPKPPVKPNAGVPDPPGPNPEKAQVQAQQEQLARQQAELDNLNAELAALQQENDQLAQDILTKKQEIQRTQSDLATVRSLSADYTAEASSLQKELEAALDANGLNQDALRCYTGKDGVNALLQESEALTARMDAALKKLVLQRTQEAEERFQSVT